MLETRNKMTLVNPIGYLHVQNFNDQSIVNQGGILNQLVTIDNLKTPRKIILSAQGNRVGIMSPTMIYTLDLSNKRYTSTKLKIFEFCYFVSKDKKQKMIIATDNSLKIVYNSVTEAQTKRTDNGNNVKAILPNYLRNIFVCVSNHSLQIYDFTLKRIKCIYEKDSIYVSACISSDGQYIIAAMNTGKLIIYDLSTFAALEYVNIGIAIVKSQIQTTSKGRIIISIPNKGILISQNPQNKLKFIFYPLPIKRFKILKDSQIIILSEDDSSIFILELNKGDLSKLYKIFSVPLNKSIIEFKIHIENSLFVGLGKQGQIYFSKIQPLDKVNYIEVKKFEDDAYLNYIKAPQEKSEPRYKKIVFKSSRKYQFIKNLENFIGKKGADMSPEQILYQYYQIYKILPERQNTHPLLLHIPLNVNLYETILNNSKISHFPELTSLKGMDKKIKFQLQNILKAIFTINDRLSLEEKNIERIIQMIYPFACLYRNQIKTVQIFLTLMKTWGRGFFGGDSQEKLKKIMQICFQKLIPNISQHFLKVFKVRFENYVYPSLVVFLVDMLGEQRWLKFLDTLILMRESSPQFYLIFIAAYFQALQSQILNIGCIQDLHNFVLEENNINIDQIIKIAIGEFQNNCPQEVHNYYQQIPEKKITGDQQVYFELDIPQSSIELLPSNDKQIKKLKQQVLKLESKIETEKNEQLILLQRNLRKAQQQCEVNLRIQMKTKQRQRRERIQYLKNSEQSWDKSLAERELLQNRYQKIYEELLEGMKRIDDIKYQDRIKDQAVYKQQTLSNLKKINIIKEMIRQQVEKKSIAEMRQKEKTFLNKQLLKDVQSKNSSELSLLKLELEQKNSMWLQSMKHQIENIINQQQKVNQKRMEIQKQFDKKEKLQKLERLRRMNQELDREQRILQKSSKIQKEFQEDSSENINVSNTKYQRYYEKKPLTSIHQQKDQTEGESRNRNPIHDNKTKGAFKNQFIQNKIKNYKENIAKTNTNMTKNQQTLQKNLKKQKFINPPSKGQQQSESESSQWSSSLTSSRQNNKISSKRDHNDSDFSQYKISKNEKSPYKNPKKQQQRQNQQAQYSDSSYLSSFNNQQEQQQQQQEQEQQQDNE